jgi:hypothetical protein
MGGCGSDGDGERVLTSRIVPQANKLETVRQLVVLARRDIFAIASVRRPVGPAPRVLP